MPSSSACLTVEDLLDGFVEVNFAACRILINDFASFVAVLLLVDGSAALGEGLSDLVSALVVADKVEDAHAVFTDAQAEALGPTAGGKPFLTPLAAGTGVPAHSGNRHLR